MINTYSTVTSLEAVELLLGRWELVLGDLGLQDLLDELPELLVFLVEQDDDAGALRVEGRRDVLDGFGRELVDARVGDWDLGGELVAGAAVAHRVEEGHLLGHGWCGGSEVAGWEVGSGRGRRRRGEESGGSRYGSCSKGGMQMWGSGGG